MTFRNAEELRAIVRDLPLDRLLVETDAPYLAPVPYRGKRNEPAFVAATAAAVAALKGVDAGAAGRDDARQFLPPVHQGEPRPPDEGDGSRLRRFDRRAGDRPDLGPVRSRPIRATAGGASRCWSRSARSRS